MREILKIREADNGKYEFVMPPGTNIAELAFAVAGLVRCLVRDEVIPNKQTYIDLFNKYLNDEQYDEVEQDDEQIAADIDAAEEPADAEVNE